VRGAEAVGSEVLGVVLSGLVQCKVFGEGKVVSKGKIMELNWA